jgi:hypothetical protein
MSTSAITGRIIYKQDIRANLDANIRSNSLVFDLTNSRLLYSPSGTSYYEFYPGQTSGGGGGSGSVTSVGATSNTLSISNSPITSAGNIFVNLSAIGSQGIYEKVSVDSYGRVVSGSALTSADIPALGYISVNGGVVLGNLSGTNFYGSFKGNSDSSNILTTPRNITLSGDISTVSHTFDGGSDISFGVHLSPNGVVSGTYSKSTVDSYGRVVSGSSLTSADIPALGYVSISAIQAIANQTLVLISGVSASTVSATSAGLVSFQYGIVPNMLGIIVSGTSAGSYTANYNIYTTNDGSTLTKIAYGTISNLNYVDSNIMLNAYNNSSFVADVSISGSVSNPGISISVKS